MPFRFVRVNLPISGYIIRIWSLVGVHVVIPITKTSLVSGQRGHPSNLLNVKTVCRRVGYILPNIGGPNQEPKQPLAPAHNNSNNNIKSLYCHSVPFPTEIMTYPELAGIFLWGSKFPTGGVKQRAIFHCQYAFALWQCTERDYIMAIVVSKPSGLFHWLAYGGLLRLDKDGAFQLFSRKRMAVVRAHHSPNSLTPHILWPLVNNSAW